MTGLGCFKQTKKVDRYILGSNHEFKCEEIVNGTMNPVGMTCAFRPAVMQPNPTSMGSMPTPASNNNPHQNNILSTFDPMWKQQRATTTYAPYKAKLF